MKNINFSFVMMFLLGLGPSSSVFAATTIRGIDLAQSLGLCEGVSSVAKTYGGVLLGGRIAVALTIEGHEVRAVADSIESCGAEEPVRECLAPLGEVEVAGDDCGAALVAFRDQDLVRVLSQDS